MLLPERYSAIAVVARHDSVARQPVVVLRRVGNFVYRVFEFSLQFGPVALRGHKCGERQRMPPVTGSSVPVTERP